MGSEEVGGGGAESELDGGAGAIAELVGVDAGALQGRGAVALLGRAEHRGGHGGSQEGALGFGSTGASRLALLIGVAVLAVGAFLFRADRTSERPFLVALGAGLLTTPILWPHYLVLLALPTALARPRFSVWWLLPLLLWFDGDGRSGGDPGRILAVLCLAFAVFAVAERAGKQRADAFADGALGASQA